jgi:phosphoglycolate phosphatase-like HAD superfamily hydrolase
MRRYAAVMLDVDGTLVDSNVAHAHAWVDAFAERGVEVSVERVQRMIGMGGDRVIETVMGSQDDALSERRSELFRERWLSHVGPLLGSRELLLRLRSEGYPYVLASAAKADELEAVLQAAGIADLCELRTTSDDVDASKPDPASIEAALRKLDVDRSRVVMAGDTPYDLQAARGASVDLIGFTSGGWSYDALAGAVAIYDHPAGLLAAWAASPLGDARASSSPARPGR